MKRINLISNYSKKAPNSKSQNFCKLVIGLIGHYLDQLGQLVIRSIRNYKRSLTLTLAFLLVLTIVIINPAAKTPHAEAAWYNSSWNYRQKIIIDHNKVPNTDQTDFPVLIKITDANNAVFAKAQDDGDDIRFTSSNETTDLSFEVENFNKATPELIAWVKIPTLSYATDTTIYLYYGNAAATAPSTAEKQAVWSNGYAGVWHMGETGSNPQINDSTSNGNNSSSNSTDPTSSGKIGGAAAFTAANSDYVGIPASTGTNFDQIDAFTVDTWVNTSTLGAEKYIFNKQDAVNPRFVYSMYLTSGNKIRFSVAKQGIAEVHQDSTNTISSGQWYHIVGVSDGSNISLYVNGSTQGSPVAITFSSSTQSVANIGLGRWYIATEYWNGFVDDTRVSATNHSADWIATEYNNQNSPSTFATISGEVGKDNYTIPTAPAGWYDMAWGSRQLITLNPTFDKVPNTAQTDFPTLVKITDVSNDIWAKAQADGDDILFADTAGNKLAHEIEKYDPATHELIAWVKIPTLATGDDTHIYMYYGNSSSASQQSATAVWSNGFRSVYHMGDSVSPFADSLANKNATMNGNLPNKVGAKIGAATDFDGTGDYGITGSFTPPTGDMTISVWAKPDNVTSRDVFSWANGYNNLQFDRQLYIDSSGKPHFYLYNDGFINTTGITNMTIGSWFMLTGTINSVVGSKIWVNGLNEDTNVLGTSGYNAFATPVVIIGGKINGPTYGANDFDGTLDEIRISSITRSSDWIATEYNNQNDPAGFETFDAAETADNFAPNNPTVITGTKGVGGDPLGTAGNFTTPYYSWPQPEAVGGASDQTGAYVSGVAGYYSYFGTSCGVGGADPVASRGVLSDTGSGLHYSSDISVSVPDLTTNQGTYCLRLKTKDNAGNISTVSEVATYIYDTTNPNAPTFVAANPAGYSSTNSFDFTWPVATDVAGDGSSGIAGYQYKRGGTSGDSWSATQTATSIADIASYQTGENIFIVRSVDNAGNYSVEVQTTYYYSFDPPTKPTALTVTPALNDENAFSFSWTAPVHARPIVDYGYSINAVPTTDNLTWTGDSLTSLTAAPFATLQGVNILYLVAKDDSGAYALDVANYASAEFICQTVAPPIPLGVTVSDSSNRAYSTYSLTIKWLAGTGQDPATFDHYLIERSTNGTDFATLSTTSSTAYIDVSSLNNATTYYYRIKAVDNADSTSAASTIVSRIPTGKYTTPPTIIQGPESAAKASTATITWVTNRTSTAGVRFGTNENNLTRSQIDPTESTDHSITIPGLEGSTRYYYQVQSLDNDRDYSSDDAYSSTLFFDTLALPVIADVKISNITLNSADLSWTTSSAANANLAYGTSISYGTAWQDSESYTTNHTYKFTDLAHTTSYHFKITGVDQDGNSLVSDDYVFDTLPLPKISAVNFETDLTQSEPKSYITWTTNVATTSSVDYSPQDGSISYEESQSSYVTSHKVELAHLSDNTTYIFTVYGSDQFGNKTTSDVYSFSTPFDSRPAQISDVSVESSNVGLNKQDKAQIVVSWHTDEPATTQVEYGQGVTDNYTNKTSEDKTLSNEHFVIISDLIPNAPYHLRAVSHDKGENISVSDDISSIPGEVPRSMLQTILDTFNNVFGWIGDLI